MICHIKTIKNDYLYLCFLSIYWTKYVNVPKMLENETVHWNIHDKPWGFQKCDIMYVVQKHVNGIKNEFHSLFEEWGI